MCWTYKNYKWEINDSRIQDFQALRTCRPTNPGTTVKYSVRRELTLPMVVIPPPIASHNILREASTFGRHCVSSFSFFCRHCLLRAVPDAPGASRAPMSTVTEQAGSAHPSTAEPSAVVRNGDGGGATAPAHQSKNSRKRSRKREPAAGAVTAGAAVAAVATGGTPATTAALATATTKTAADDSFSRTKARFTIDLSGGDGNSTHGGENVQGARSHSARAAKTPAIPSTIATETWLTRPLAGQEPSPTQPETLPSANEIGKGRQEAVEHPAARDNAPGGGDALPTAVSPASSSPGLPVVEPLSPGARPDVDHGEVV